LTPLTPLTPWTKYEEDVSWNYFSDYQMDCRVFSTHEVQAFALD